MESFEPLFSGGCLYFIVSNWLVRLFAAAKKTKMYKGRIGYVKNFTITWLDIIALSIYLILYGVALILVN